MGAFIGILIVAALIGMVVWNHKNAEAAMNGVEFGTAQSPHEVCAAISAAYCGGAKAKAKSVLSGVKVQPLAGSAFALSTKIGDEGRIEVLQGQGSGAVVRAAATSLYVGSHPKGHFKSGWLGLSARIGHGIYKVLGITPNAAKMKRFVNGIEGRVAKQAWRASQG